jgi:lipopolysaccharide transport system ATP-binding protein
MKPAIRVDNLSKCYRIGTGPRGQYRTLREAISSAVTAPWRRLAARLVPKHNAGDAPDILWALKDVCFDVRPGEVIGIIGRNGAGKSTLLKILSQITEPTRGQVRRRGRLGSLLEVGTGFHPELTGRENIFLNGAILGMSRREIQRRFDDIVAFSEISKFLDTPVKRYSSGMYVRLAFAVAAHLEPEILVVDEVLAVGDVQFQRKCLGKMQDVGRQGRTILFVSHNLAALQALCRRGIVLHQGALVADGPVAESVALYLQSLETLATTDLAARTDRRGGGQARLVQVEIGSGGGNQEGGLLAVGSRADFTFHADRLLPGLTCAFKVLDQYGYPVTKFNSALGSLDDALRPDREPVFVCTVDELLLAPGRYRLDVVLRAGGEVQDRIDAAAFFDVGRGAVRGRKAPPSNGDWKFCMPHRWQSPQ